MADDPKNPHIFVDGVPLKVRVDEDTRSEIQKVRDREVADHSYSRPAMSKMAPLRRKQRDVLPRAAQEEQVRRIKDALQRTTGGLLYSDFLKHYGVVLPRTSVSKICRDLGAKKFRKTFQGPVYVGFKVPEGVKAYGSRKESRQEESRHTSRKAESHPCESDAKTIADMLEALRVTGENLRATGDELVALVTALKKKVAKS